MFFNFGQAGNQTFLLCHYLSFFFFFFNLFLTQNHIKLGKIIIVHEKYFGSRHRREKWNEEQWGERLWAISRNQWLIFFLHVNCMQQIQNSGTPFSDSPKGNTRRYSRIVFGYSSIKLIKPSPKPGLGWWSYLRLICVILVTLSIYHSHLEKTKLQFQSISIETSHFMYCQIEKHCSYFET